jgi:hypothetical protein
MKVQEWRWRSNINPAAGGLQGRHRADEQRIRFYHDPMAAYAPNNRLTV